MKKLLVAIGLATALVMPAVGQNFAARTFFADNVRSITVSNAAAAPFGGLTNINSWLSTANGSLVGTNALILTWTNGSGTWVIPTNNVPGTVTGISFVTNNSTALLQDVSLYGDRNGQLLSMVVSNDGATFISPQNISVKLYGAASASGTLNLIFVGLPDGTNEVTGANGTPATFQWGVTPAAGYSTQTTNFPSWKFAGCGKIRLRSASLTTSSAANIGVSILGITLDGYVP